MNFVHFMGTDIKVIFAGPTECEILCYFHIKTLFNFIATKTCILLYSRITYLKNKFEKKSLNLHLLISKTNTYISLLLKFSTIYLPSKNPLNRRDTSNS